jgi:hypothetical protein
MSIGLHPARSLAWKIARLYPPSGGVKRTVSGQPVACVRCAWVGDANCPGRGRTLDHRFAVDGGEGGRALASGMQVQASAKVVRMPRVATRLRALDKGDGARSLRTERVIQVSDE